jgi:hypothetical protein
MKIRHGPFGDVIGRRRLHITGAPRQIVTVSLGKPRPTPGTPDWECPFRIRGAGINRVDYGYGVDGIQAMSTALEGIRYALDNSGKSLSYYGVDGTFFQKWIPFWGDAALTKRLERMVEREIRREVKRLEQRYKKREAARREAARRPVKGRPTGQKRGGR